MVISRMKRKDEQKKKKKELNPNPRVCPHDLPLDVDLKNGNAAALHPVALRRRCLSR
jgi:hypothetical protein